MYQSEDIHDSITRILTKYNLDKTGISSSPIRSAFFCMLEQGFENLKEKHPEEYKSLFDRDEIIIGDVGSADMGYGPMLGAYFGLNISKVKIAGIEPNPETSLKRIKALEPSAKRYAQNANIEFIPIPRRYEESEELLKKNGIHHFDLITGFAPKWFIDFNNSLPEFTKDALAFIAMGYCEGRIGKGDRDMAKDFGDKYLIKEKNEYADLNGKLFRYDPFMIYKAKDIGSK